MGIPLYIEKTGMEGKYDYEPCLPRTFREAIEICSALGIQHIWIDSLCIIQDDLGDWQAEAGRMDSVYANAALTIAASAAASIAEGCFVETESFGTRLSSYDPLAVRGGTSFIELNTRAWTLQEHVLSRRVLHCTSPELRWQCNSAYCIEAGIRPPEFMADGIIRTLPELLSSSDFCDAERGDIVMTAWRRWISSYSHRDVSVPLDRLAALSGIVQAITREVGYTHLLGCWAETLCTDLSWVASSTLFEDRQDPKTMIKGLPSWTWLSSSYPVDQHHENDMCPRIRETSDPWKDHTQLVATDIRWEGQPLVSALKRGHLDLRGPVLSLTFSGKRDPVVAPLDLMDDGTYHCGSESDTQPPGTYPCLVLQSREAEREIKSHVLAVMMLKPVDENNDVTRGASISEHKFNSNDGTQGNVLQCYRRVGFAWAHCEGGNIHDWPQQISTVIRLV
ncbi:uncharacterized protein B0I36DRAFT_385174 [Microdochium trichocladiopsis]|uniref:Heterokaryon incompatibility domain-containing protein n=1 Tax=Microdochium trichocladiopsis TaxID=1682393 RepID=A0A9P9BQ18_9PEZI|nr:uncharacterized protein B0I36DRAFT_385174 [Microdochium trichocladiopsis]KAH7029817.1 hypothetical protein B0I36DRAFT_385174 [Microdochium trichocladiopsis]